MKDGQLWWSVVMALCTKGHKEDVEGVSEYLTVWAEKTMLTRCQFV